MMRPIMGGEDFGLPAGDAGDLPLHRRGERGERDSRLAPPPALHSGRGCFEDGVKMHVNTAFRLLDAETGGEE